MNQKRESRGIPVGGQFAAERRSESDVELPALTESKADALRLVRSGVIGRYDMRGKKGWTGQRMTAAQSRQVSAAIKDGLVHDNSLSRGRPVELSTSGRQVLNAYEESVGTDIYDRIDGATSDVARIAYDWNVEDDGGGSYLSNGDGARAYIERPDNSDTPLRWTLATDDGVEDLGLDVDASPYDVSRKLTGR